MDLHDKLKMLGAGNASLHAGFKKYETFTLDDRGIGTFFPLEQELMAKAVEIRKNSYEPYSHFAVGACILGSGHKFYWGANIETADYRGLHAEESAIANMKSHGAENILAIAVAMKNSDGFPMPCGACRQKLYEFSEGNIPIIGVSLNGLNQIWRVDLTSIGYLLPNAFGRRNL